MKSVNNDVFLNKIGQRIKNGDFDTYLTLPFMTKNLLYINIKEKINKKLSTGATPILSDNEIKECIEDVKEAATYIVAIYLKLGFMERIETGFQFTEKGKKIIRIANKK